MVWYCTFLQQNCFVLDTIHRVVHTSTCTGTIVYPDLDMHAQSLTALTPTSIHATANATAAVFQDLDSLLFDYPGKTRHTAPYFYKCDKDEKRHLKQMNIGANTANK